MKNTLLSFVIILSSITSCKDSQKTAINSNATITSTPQTEREYKLNVSQSKINWTGYKIQKSLNLSHFGVIQFQKGILVFKNNKLESGILTADLSSLTNEDEENIELNKKLIHHLKSEDFLDLVTYPYATFTIVSAKNIEESSDYNTEIEGELTFKNISKIISIKANIRVEENSLFLNTEKFSINRQDFGITYKGMGDILLSNNFDLQISILASKI